MAKAVYAAKLCGTKLPPRNFGTFSGVSGPVALTSANSTYIHRAFQNEAHLGHQPQMSTYSAKASEIKKDWVLIDANDVIIHVFRPEVRTFYNLEKMWQAPDLDATRH